MCTHTGGSHCYLQVVGCSVGTLGNTKALYVLKPSVIDTVFPADGFPEEANIY